MFNKVILEWVSVTIVISLIIITGGYSLGKEK